MNNHGKYLLKCNVTNINYKSNITYVFNFWNNRDFVIIL